jgi:hypothetical protein
VPTETNTAATSRTGKGVTARAHRTSVAANLVVAALAALAVVFLSLAVGRWLLIIGMCLAALATIGWMTYKYLRGEHSI